MLRPLATALLLILLLPGSAALATRVCSAGTSLLTFQLAAEPAGGRSVPLSVRSLNRLEAGQKLLYSPVRFHSEKTSKGKVAIVLVPADAGGKLVVLKSKPAKAAAEWKVPFRTSVVALVYGPDGLNTGKVSTLVEKDEELIVQLADYAEQTAKTEKLVEALSSWDRSPSATDNLNAALAGFSSSFGRSVPQLNRNAPADQQLATLMRALNPALATYDPLAPEPRQRMRQSALLASSVAGLFFGTPVGLAAGGAAMFVNMGAILFPNTDFRSAFVQQAPSNSLALCAKRQAKRSRTRLAYLWAVRIPNADAPLITLVGVAHLPLGCISRVKVRLKPEPAWKHLDRVRDWELTAPGGGRAIPVPVRILAGERAVELDLRKVEAEPGDFRLVARWDWSPLEVQGEIHLHRISGRDAPRLTPASQDSLVTGTGPVTVTLTGCDFEFVEKVSLRKSNEAAGKARAVEFRLPKGARGGPQQRMEAVIDTAKLEPGDYILSLSLPNAVTREIPVHVLPPHPKFSGLPLRVNLGEQSQRIRFSGTGMERIEGLECPEAEIELTGSGEAIVHLAETVQEGDELDLLVKVKGLHAPLRIPGAIRVAGPRPRFEQVRTSLPGGAGVALAEGELPAGSVVSFAIRLAPAGTNPSIRLGCTEKETLLRAETIRVGEQHGSIRLRGAGKDTLFLSLDPGEIGRAGCELVAVAATEAEGASEARILGKVVRLPRINSFELTGERAGEQGYLAILKGEDLELIERTGWDGQTGLPVTELPTPVGGSSHKQSLRIVLPWPAPAPHAPLFIWLRGEVKGRQTTARY